MVSPQKLESLIERINKPENTQKRKELESLRSSSDDSIVIYNYFRDVCEKVEYIKSNPLKEGDKGYRDLSGIDANASALINAIHDHMDKDGWK